MDISRTKPVYNLKVAVQKTGIKADTLRAWERRYDLPQPGRTSGGHRLYSQEDIEIVQWLMARLEEGMTIGLAVDLWHSLIEKGEDPLASIAFQTPSSPITTEIGSALEDLRQQWIDHCLEYDDAGADAVLSHAFALFPVEMVCEQILLAGLAEIGDMWFQNKVTVQQEHFASALTMQRLDALVAAVPRYSRPGRILLACPAQEEHTIALRTLTLLLRHQGWRVLYLGANVPAAHFEDTLEAAHPDLVILAAQRLLTAASLLNSARLLEQAGILCAYGGQIFNLEPALRKRIPAHFLGESIFDALPVVEQIISFKPAPAEVPATSPENQQAINLFRSRQALIGADAWRMLKAEQSFYPYVQETNERMAHSISSALFLGQIDLMDKELEYTRQLMVNHNIPLEWTNNYLDAYYQAASWHLSSDCQMIVDWLDKARKNGR